MHHADDHTSIVSDDDSILDPKHVYGFRGHESAPKDGYEPKSMTKNPIHRQGRNSRVQPDDKDSDQDSDYGGSYETTINIHQPESKPKPKRRSLLDEFTSRMKRRANHNSNKSHTKSLDKHDDHHDESCQYPAKVTIWLTAALMLIGSIITFIFWLTTEDNEDRSIYGFTFTITLVATLAYCAKGIGQGTITVFGKDIAWARYLDWLVTTPLLMVDLCKLAHAPSAVMIMLVCIDIIMITGGIGSAMTTSRPRSVFWFLISCAFYMLMVILIQSELDKSLVDYDDDVKMLFSIFKMMTLSTWSFYPIVVFVSDQNAFCTCGVLNHNQETIALAILDIISKLGVEILLVAMKSITKSDYSKSSNSTSYGGGH